MQAYAIVINKVIGTKAQGHTCLSPMKSYSYCSLALALLELLIFKCFEQRSFYATQSPAQTYKQQTSTTKNNTPKQKKGFKRVY